MRRQHLLLPLLLMPLAPVAAQDAPTSTAEKICLAPASGGLLRRMAGGAAEQGVWSVAAGAGSTAGRIAAGAAAGAPRTAAWNYAHHFRTKDVDMDLGQLPESARPLAVGLAKIARAKLK
jgi:hypothetical protein